tara:strand:+ start:243 stop:374 length:132 start_codon:yes stop_codon:yes gene_type:complete
MSTKLSKQAVKRRQNIAPAADKLRCQITIAKQKKDDHAAGNSL